MSENERPATRLENWDCTPKAWIGGERIPIVVEWHVEGPSEAA